MKLKSRPEDFIVKEISNFKPDPTGSFFVYELEKRSLATMEALRIIAKRAGMRPKDLSASGLKDKHALTTQLFSCPKALPGDVGDEQIAVKLVGKSASKLTAGFIVGNRFDITLRNLSQDDVDVLPQNISEIKRTGVPNYYDNQRFGGIAHGQGFLAKALLQGDIEEALRLHLAVPHRKQNMTDKKNRRLARDMWGDWTRLHKKMRKSPERALVEFLRDNPGKWAECFDRITPTLRNLFVAAYQSYLFNETLRRLMLSEADTWVITRNRAGELVFPRETPEETLQRWREGVLPLVGASTNVADYPLATGHLQPTLDEEQVSLDQLKLPYLRRTRFKAAERPVLMNPDEFEMDEPVPDELNEGAFSVRVTFVLPRGSFATIITRRLVLGAHPREETISRL